MSIRRADYYYIEGVDERRPPSTARWGPTVEYTVTATPVKVADENPRRVRIIIQNIGPADIYVMPSQASSRGIFLRSAETLIDEVYNPHIGEVWLKATNGTATVLVTEVNV